MRSINLKILLILTFSLVVVEGVILVFTGADHRSELIDHYVFQARIIARSIDHERLSETSYQRELLAALSEESVVRIAPGPVEPSWELENGTMLRYGGYGATIDILAEGIPAMTRAFIWNTIGVVAIIVFFMVVTSFFFLNLWIVRPLRSLLGGFRAIVGTEGDLTQRLELATADEVGRIGEAFNAFVAQIAQTVARVRDSASASFEISSALRTTADTAAASVATASDAAEAIAKLVEDQDVETVKTEEAARSITSRMDGMVDSAQTQRGAVSDALASVEELNGSIGNLNSIAEARRAAAESLRTMALGGLEKMRASVDAISEMESSTSEMLGLIDVINDVAGQTNLLSLNAAIEAAHAGESGRGFAVVADEIGKLAKQTSEHARSIDASLKREVESIGLAGAANREAVDLFERTAEEIEALAGSITEIVAGLAEQLVATQEILRAEQVIDDVAERTMQRAEGARELLGTIQHGIEHLAGNSRTILDAIGTAASQLDRARSSMDSVVELSAKNDDVARGVHDELSRFTLPEETKALTGGDPPNESLTAR